jgi:hypothetical protein
MASADCTENRARVCTAVPDMTVPLPDLVAAPQPDLIAAPDL